MCNVTDASQGFPAEPVCAYLFQILILPQFGCGEPLADNLKVFTSDTWAIILNLNIKKLLVYFVGRIVMDGWGKKVSNM